MNKSPRLTYQIKILAIVILAGLFVIGTVYAQSSQVTLTVDTQYGTTVGAGSYSLGANVTFGVASNAVPCGVGCRYSFTGWSGSGSGSYTGPDYQATVTMNGDIVETASWALQYYLNIIEYPSNSTGIVSPQAGWVDNGTVVTVSAQNDPGNNWYFMCWGSQQGSCDQGLTPQHQVAVTGSYTLYANYFHVGITTTNTPQKNKFGGLEGNADGTYYPGDSLCSTSQMTIYPSGYNVTLSAGTMNMTLGSTIFTNATTPQLSPSKATECFSISPTATYGSYPMALSDSYTVSYNNMVISGTATSTPTIQVVNYNPQDTVIVTYPQYKDSPGPGGNATVYCSSIDNCDPTIFYRPAVILVKYYGNCPVSPDCSNPTTAERLSADTFSEQSGDTGQLP